MSDSDSAGADALGNSGRGASPAGGERTSVTWQQTDAQEMLDFDPADKPKPDAQQSSRRASAAAGAFDVIGGALTTAFGSQGATAAAAHEAHRVANRPLPLQFVEKNIAERIAMDGFYTDFFVYIPFVVLFMVFFLNGRNIETNHMSAAASKKMLMATDYPATSTTQTLLDAQGDTSDPVLPADRRYKRVDRARRWHTWFRDVMIPMVWDCEGSGYSRTTLLKRGQMQFLGAMRLRVLTMAPDSCTLNSHYKGADTPKLLTSCYSAFQMFGSGISKRERCNITNPTQTSEKLWQFVDPTKVMKTDASGVTKAAASIDLKTTGQHGLYPSSGYTLTLPFNATCDQVRAVHNAIQSSDECNIINDLETRFVMTEWFQYGSNTDQYMMNKFFFEVTASGAWVTNHQVRMFPVWTSRRLVMSIFDICFFIFVLYFVYRLVYDWVMFYRTQHKILAFCLDTWNLLELVNIATLLAVSILRWMWWTRSQSTKKEYPFPFEYPADLDSLVLVFSAMIYANSVNVVITVLKVLKYFQLNNRLNILTRTLAVSQQGIIGVLALFLFIVGGYAICGTALYGTNLNAFKNVNSSFSSLAFLLLGQFEYTSMRALQPWLTALYFFSFVIVGNFLLLNFIIAILSDGFAQVNKNTALEPLDETVLRQVYVLRETVSFRNLKKLIELRKKGKTRQMLLHNVHKYLNEHVEMLAKQCPEELHNDVPMYRHDLRHWLPEQLYHDLGDRYIEMLWEDIAHDYHLFCMGGTHQVRREIQAAVTEAVAMTASEERVVPVLKDVVEGLQRVDDVVERLTSGIAEYNFADDVNDD